MYTYRYEKFIKELVLNEGGFQKNPKDRGNYHNGVLVGTYCGISAKNYYSTLLKILNLLEQGKKTEADEMVKSFYYTTFYNTYYDTLLSERIAFKLFDVGVNTGTRFAVKVFQKTMKKYYLIDLKADGVFGRQTYVKAQFLLREHSENVLYNQYLDELEKGYKSFFSYPSFGKGWIARLRRVINF